MVVATSNPGKLRELQSLLEGIRVDGREYALTSLAQLGLSAPEETGSSFVANALLKAQHAAEYSGQAALADDSGLEVDALGGAPGIYSARYAGAALAKPEEMAAANNARLLSELTGTPLESRTARFRCALAFLDAPHASPLIVEGIWEGYIIDAPQGTGGFGYDPYFWLPDQQLTAAQLSAESKNRLSHRGKALRGLRDALLARSKDPR